MSLATSNAPAANQAPPVDTLASFDKLQLGLLATAYGHQGFHDGFLKIGMPAFTKTPDFAVLERAAQLVEFPEAPEHGQIALPRWFGTAENLILDNRHVSAAGAFWGHLFDYKFDPIKVRLGEDDESSASEWFRSVAKGYRWPSREEEPRLEWDQRESLNLRLLGMASAARFILDTYMKRLWGGEDLVPRKPKPKPI